MVYGFRVIPNSGLMTMATPYLQLTMKITILKHSININTGPPIKIIPLLMNV